MTLCCNACSWTDVSLNTKSNCVPVQMGHILPKNPESTSAISEEPGARTKGREQKAGYCTRPLHTMPPKGWANHPSGLTPGHTPTLTPYEEPGCPALVSEQAREPVVSSHSLLLQQEPQENLA